MVAEIYWGVHINSCNSLELNRDANFPDGTLLLSLRLYVSVSSDAWDLLPESTFAIFYGLTAGLWTPDHEPVASSIAAFASRTLCNVPRSFRCWKGLSEGNERCCRCTRVSDCAATRIIAFAKIQRREFSIQKIISGGKTLHTSSTNNNTSMSGR